MFILPGKCLERRDLDKGIMMLRLINGRIFGTTINKLFFFSSDGMRTMAHLLSFSWFQRSALGGYTICSTGD
jgi:hypothetical protein